jgi:hypothetical protein
MKFRGTRYRTYNEGSKSILKPFQRNTTVPFVIDQFKYTVYICQDYTELYVEGRNGSACSICQSGSGKIDADSTPTESESTTLFVSGRDRLSNAEVLQDWIREGRRDQVQRRQVNRPSNN